MRRIKDLMRELGLNKKLYLLICLCLLLITLFEWQTPVAGEPIARAYDYQYGRPFPWLHIYKTADLGSQHLFQALAAGHSLANGWVIDGMIFGEELIIFIGIGIVRYFLYRRKTNTVQAAPLQPNRTLHD